MGTRIRYVEQGGKLVSNKSYGTLVVLLDKQLLNYEIVDVATDRVVMVGDKTKNLSTLKLKAKAALTTLGVSFTPETRNRVSASETSRTV